MSADSDYNRKLNLMDDEREPADEQDYEEILTRRYERRNEALEWGGIDWP